MAQVERLQTENAELRKSAAEAGARVPEQTAAPTPTYTPPPTPFPTSAPAAAAATPEAKAKKQKLLKVVLVLFVFVVFGGGAYYLWESRQRKLKLQRLKRQEEDETHARENSWCVPDSRCSLLVPWSVLSTVWLREHPCHGPMCTTAGYYNSMGMQL